jgi:uncharacterized tellurite resistance protein B-like protein
MTQALSDFTPKGALSLAAISVLGADGEYRDDELKQLQTLIQADEQAFLKAVEFYGGRPAEACIQVVTNALNDAQKRAALEVLCGIAQADGDVAKSEKEIIRRYAEAFGVALDAINIGPAKPIADLSVFDEC